MAAHACGTLSYSHYKIRVSAEISALGEFPEQRERIQIHFNVTLYFLPFSFYRKDIQQTVR